MVPLPKQGLQKQQTRMPTPSCPGTRLLICNISSAVIARKADSFSFFFFSYCLILINSAVKINITEASLKDTQCIFVSESLKCTLASHLSSHRGRSPVLFGAPVELFQTSGKLAGCQLPRRRTRERLDLVMSRRRKICHLKTASGSSLDRGGAFHL